MTPLSRALFVASLVLVTPSIGFAACFTNTDNFSGTIANNALEELLGCETTSSYDQYQDTVGIFQKATNYSGTTTNTPLYSSIFKETNASGSRAQAAYFECQDDKGWNGTGEVSFCEGIRSQATLSTRNSIPLLGSAYGGVFSAGEELSATHTYLIGVEAEVIPHSADAPEGSQSVLHNRIVQRQLRWHKEGGCGLSRQPLDCAVRNGGAVHVRVPRSTGNQ
jgi:hypothetical protein